MDDILTSQEQKVLLDALHYLKDAAVRATKERRESALQGVREEIQKFRFRITQQENAMREGLGPFDIEDFRIFLDELRKLEKWLMGLDSPPAAS